MGHKFNLMIIMLKFLTRGKNVKQKIDFRNDP